MGLVEMEGDIMRIDGVAHHTAAVNGIRMHYADAGRGAPVFLLHGFPETWFAWRKQIPALAERYRVIVPDLRGYGDTEKPPAGYDRRTMANDIYALMRYLGYARVALIGHDRGARVATRFSKDHRAAIDRLAVLDNVPTRVIFETLDAARAKAQWWFLFNGVPDLPEALIAGREEIWLRYLLKTWTYESEALSDEEIAVYTKAYMQAGATRGAFSDYRAAQEDVAQDTADTDQPIDRPTLTIWGADFAAVAGIFDVLDIWKGMARDVRGVEIPRCGHLPQEERPEAVNRELLTFLDGWRG